MENTTNQDSPGRIQPVSSRIILIVEDDEASLLYLDSVLKKANALILHASNGQEAVDLCSARQISVVLMDLKMPEMDGFEATRIIKSNKPDLPVIAITAYAMNGDERRALEAGCDDYLAKPLRKELLLKKMLEYGISLHP